MDFVIEHTWSTDGEDVTLTLEAFYDTDCGLHLLTVNGESIGLGIDNLRELRDFLDTVLEKA